MSKPDEEEGVDPWLTTTAEVTGELRQKGSNPGFQTDYKTHRFSPARALHWDIPRTIDLWKAGNSFSDESFLLSVEPACFNLLLGRLWLHQTKAVPSSVHQKLKLPLYTSVVTIQGICMENMARSIMHQYSKSNPRHLLPLFIRVWNLLRYQPQAIRLWAGAADGKGLGREHGCISLWECLCPEIQLRQ